MSATTKLDRSQAAEFLDGLRRDISAARLRVTLDEKLGHETPAAVKKLAALPEPPSIEGGKNPPIRSGARVLPDSGELILSVIADASATGTEGFLIAPFHGVMREAPLGQEVPVAARRPQGA